MIVTTTTILMLSMLALPQEATPPASPPPATTEEGTTPPPADPIGDLDDLLGLEGDDDAEDAGPVIDDPDRVALDQALSMTEATQDFQEAVQLMEQTARRLEQGGDTGLVTQRLQDDILRRLDAMINAAEQQQQQQQQQRQQQQQQQQQPNQQQQQQSQSEQSGDGDNQDERVPPIQQSPIFSDGVDGAMAAWGHLPQRLRDALSQGTTDAFSSMYKSMTEAYYRRLAEDRDR
ncbi:MAG: hypothetical protein KDA28_14035 [Phycisphaerales bacterium]|nr:hypothetical protein [Phycisphaerales bacterium]